MANDNEKQTAEQQSITNDYLRTIAEAVSQNAGTAAGGMFVAAPEKRSFLKDVAKGFAGTLVTVAKTVWHVPAAQGYLATLVVRLGVPAGAVAIITALVDAALK